MIVQATPCGTAHEEEPFAFTYTGDFTDSRVDGIGDVMLNTSGTLTVTSGTATVSVYLLAGGGGCFAYGSAGERFGTGGGGGNKTVTITLEPGMYQIVIGTGGAAKQSGVAGEYAGTGGNTTAFGETVTGGTGGGLAGMQIVGGTGGTPNGGNGTHTYSNTISGGTPNGGGVSASQPQPGGSGLVRLTFS